jgi:hypothetical protein
MPTEAQAPVTSSFQPPSAPPTPAMKPAIAAASQIKTEHHPYDMDQMLQNMKEKQMKEMESLLFEGRKKMKRYR